jgi:hypothetical protein
VPFEKLTEKWRGKYLALPGLCQMQKLQVEMRQPVVVVHRMQQWAAL